MTGLLEQICHPALTTAYPGLRVSKTSAEEVRNLLGAGASATLAQEYPLTLAVKCIGGEKPWAAIFAAMLDGRLVYSVASGTGRLVRRISIEISDVLGLRDFTFDRAIHPAFAFETDMTKRDAELALNVNPSSLPCLLKEELGRRGAAARVKVADVRRIASERISPAEICARTKLGSRALPRALKRSGVRRVGAAGWRRDEVEPLLEESAA